MTVAVLGGGLQGCCIALALANRGQDVVLFDRQPDILTRTAVANEGKVHLGWMYAADPSMSTARVMVQGALAFAPFLERHLGASPGSFTTSEPAAYAVHRESQHGVCEVKAYFAALHALIAEASAGRRDDYFGRDLSLAPRQWSDVESLAAFDPSDVLAVFDTPEVAIDPIELASRLRAAVVAHPRIEMRLEHEVESASENRDGVTVATRMGEAHGKERFDHVVNALWDGRIALDRTMGRDPGRAWIHRLKYGVSFTWPVNRPRPPSVTFISGPFGEVVSYPDMTTYLTWYPSCVLDYSSAIVPPIWATHPDEPLRSKVVDDTISSLGAIVRALRRIEPDGLQDLRVKGGTIVAWGETDIDDPESELHKRYEIGVNSWGRYHSVDPGKLTMAPFFAEICADRIARIG